MHRAVNLCHKFCDGKVSPLQDAAAGSGSSPWGGLPLPFDLDALRAKVEAGMETFALKVRRSVRRSVGPLVGAVVDGLFLCGCAADGVSFLSCPYTSVHPSLQTLCEEAMAGLRETNKFLTEAEPWKMKGDDKAEDRKRVRGTMVLIGSMPLFRLTDPPNHPR